MTYKIEETATTGKIAGGRSVKDALKDGVRIIGERPQTEKKK